MVSFTSSGFSRSALFPSILRTFSIGTIVVSLRPFFFRENPSSISLPLRVSDPPECVSGAGSGIRTHEGVTPNGCHVTGLSYPFGDLEAVALTTQPSRRNRPQHPTSLKPFPESKTSIHSKNVLDLRA